MYKVLCIKDSKETLPGFPNVEFGKTYNVTRDFTMSCPCGLCWKKLFYVLEEIPDGFAFESTFFAPLSDIEETTLIENELELA